MIKVHLERENCELKENNQNVVYLDILALIVHQDLAEVRSWMGEGREGDHGRVKEVVSSW